MSSKCNVSFMSQYCFINGEQQNVNDYIKNNKLFHPLLCQNNHELILVNGVKNIPHFRHKNTDDVGGSHTTFWHSEWQSYFPITEKTFHCKLNQIKDRRADVVLNNNTILEIQHTKYEKDEIDNRKNDYQLHGVNIIWLIDGNNTIDIKKLEYSNRVYIEFTSDYWKYTSFLSYEYIYIDIESIIYKINPKNVKSHMTDVENGKPKDKFIEYLKTGVDIWNNEEPPQCKLFIKQQGAGNGKTYGIVQMLEDDDKSHYQNFIYITKQHSAKHIIKTEFENQHKTFKSLSNIEIQQSPDQKKYIIKYFNEKSNINCQIIISTIDSFTYSIGNKKHKYYDKFEGLIYSILEGHIESKPCGTINYGGINPKLNKETLIVIDEFQDPPKHYAEAIIQIMRNKYIDVFIVGDKLQSISNEHNAFTYFLENEFPFIQTIKLEPTNICRRFVHPKLIEFVNYMIPFKEYELPQITPYKDYDGDIDEPLVFFKSDSIYKIKKKINCIDPTIKKIIPDDDDYENREKIIQDVETIMGHYKKEVDDNNRFPEDFLIVTPFTSNNPVVDALTLQLNIFWMRKFTDEPEYMTSWKHLSNVNEYYRYAIFHKSEQGTSIDLSESEFSTRIVSCHSSKGDGRNIVFIIGFNEDSIKKFSRTKNNLVYNSLFHVAITRMKLKIYIMYDENNDDIHIKLNSYFVKNDIINQTINPIIKTNKKIKYDDITRDFSNKYFKEFNETIIKLSQLEALIDNKGSKQIVDLGNHIIRYSSLFINILLEIVNKEKTNVNSEILQQITSILWSVCDSEIQPVNSMKGYYNMLNENKQDIDMNRKNGYKEKVKLVIPIIKICNNGRDYIKYFDNIIGIIKRVQIKIQAFLNMERTGVKQLKQKLLLCPIECILLNFMISIIIENVFSRITIIDIYDIVDVYNSSFNNDYVYEHNKCRCLCNTQFNETVIDSTNKKITNMKTYLVKHFEKIKGIKKTMALFHNKYPTINWLHNQYIDYAGSNDNFKIHKFFSLIGYNNEVVIIAYIKPQFNELNYNEILMNSIFDTHLIYTSKNNNGKFNGKKVITCVFTLENIEPYYIDWDDINGTDIVKNNNTLIKNAMYDNIMEKYELENNYIFHFYIYRRTFLPYKEYQPLRFIEDIIKYMEDINGEFKDSKQEGNKIPTYIIDFFKNILNEIENCDENNKLDIDILLRYDNKRFFLEKMMKKLDNYVKRYLGLNNF